MRVLHSAALLRPSAGMLNQMYWEQEASDKLGVTWHSRMYCPEGSSGPESVLVYSKYVKACNDRSGTGKVSDWLRLRYRYYQWLLSMKNDYDIFVLRYYVHVLFQLSFTKSLLSLFIWYIILKRYLNWQCLIRYLLWCGAGWKNK